MQHTERLTLAEMREFVAASDTLSFAGTGRKRIHGLLEGVLRAQNYLALSKKDKGIAGLTLGGGYGWLASRHGLACDNLIAAEVITADGSVIEANAEQHDDLFWGLRGAGANFVVETRDKAGIPRC